eukprot:1196179-Prorocentrum_minimum.AAC.8
MRTARPVAAGGRSVRKRVNKGQRGTMVCGRVGSLSTLSSTFLSAVSSAPKADVRMIDFAHVHCDCGGADKGYATGLRSLVGALKTIQTAEHLHDKKTN